MKRTNWNPSNQNYLTSTGGSQAATASAIQLMPDGLSSNQAYVVGISAPHRSPGIEFG